MKLLYHRGCLICSRRKRLDVYEGQLEQGCRPREDKTLWRRKKDFMSKTKSGILTGGSWPLATRLPNQAHVRFPNKADVKIGARQSATYQLVILPPNVRVKKAVLRDRNGWH